jgi:prephenate dehydrogenase
MRLVVIGLGLIGGSIALALRDRRPDAHVVCVDLELVIASARAAAVADELIDTRDAAAVAQALSACDLAVLATPVRAIEALLPGVLAQASAVTDCGSTKRSIIAAAAATGLAGRFVGGHPMAGVPEGGLEHARPDLFVGRSWLICPEGSSAEARSRVDELVRHTGACAVAMSAREHDRAVALTSHLPQILASALIVLAEDSGARVAAGPAFESATRVAGGPEAMWQDIFETNADEVASALRGLAELLDQARGGLAQAGPEGPNAAAALELLRRARAARM